MAVDTIRLQLTPFAPAHSLALIDGAESFEKCSGLRAANGLREFFVSDEVSPAWLAQLRASSTPDPWIHGDAVVDRASRSAVGTVGFKGAPDEGVVVEIAYGIVPGFQGRGYAAEAVGAVVAFVFRDHRVTLVRAHTVPTNHASMRVLEKCGFNPRGEFADSDDGLVCRWERINESA